MFLMLFTFGYFMGQDLVFTSFGFHDGHPTMIGLFLVFQFIFSPYYQVGVVGGVYYSSWISSNFIAMNIC